MADTGKINFESTSYVFGIVSIVMAFFSQLAGLIFGIIGFSQSKKLKTSTSKLSRKLNILGIIFSLVVFVLTIVLVLLNLVPQSFPKI